MDNRDKPISPFHPRMPHNNEADNGYSGLTKREYFAAMAMQGILSSRGLQIALCEDGIKWSEYAVTQTDALLAELEKT